MLYRLWSFDGQSHMLSHQLLARDEAAQMDTPAQRGEKMKGSEAVLLCLGV